MSFSYRDISKLIDHALLTPDLDAAALAAGCRQALAFDAASVCIVPYFVAKAARLLDGSGVLPSTTIGFPHGVQASTVKRAEAQQAVDDGAHELDVVVNISKVLSEDWLFVEDDLAAMIEVAHRAERKIKVIFENCYLQEHHKLRLCRLCGKLGADWVKTSTGFGPGGATMDDLKLMRRATPPSVQVKAAGGIRDLDSLLEARSIGVTRIGTSRTASLLNECRRRLGLDPVTIETDQPAGSY